ncbi:type II toxin-antitoxin system RelE/ParE family toxin [Haloactinopolyspora alba]|uniref:type II toxin-antitoxin system RelE/ParE family toxin n=1 Tax=Haloactinopolyspora alba TaxID=648780 RepID=UPI000D0D26C7|nr:type II toxin-antitoxin system RelE/ParE family toxin [Haloactinopolyspora alba]
MWTIIQHPDVAEWRKGLDEADAALMADALDRLGQDGPGLGRPVVDTIKNSRHHNMKELRARTIRVLFVFDPKRRAILLVGGDKRGEWNRWYKTAIKVADTRYDEWLEAMEEEGR